MLYNGSEIVRELEWVIFDEVHYVNDAEVCAVSKLSTFSAKTWKKQVSIFSEWNHFESQYKADFITAIVAWACLGRGINHVTCICEDRYVKCNSPELCGICRLGWVRHNLFYDQIFPKISYLSPSYALWCFCVWFFLFGPDLIFIMLRSNSWCFGVIPLFRTSDWHAMHLAEIARNIGIKIRPWLVIRDQQLAAIYHIVLAFRSRKSYQSKVSTHQFSRHFW